MNIGKCPKCENTVKRVDVEHVAIQSEGETNLNGQSYVCQHCQTVLGVAVDPYFIIRTTLKGVRNPEEEI